MWSYVGGFAKLSETLQLRKKMAMSQIEHQLYQPFIHVIVIIPWRKKLLHIGLHIHETVGWIQQQAVHHSCFLMLLYKCTYIHNRAMEAVLDTTIITSRKQFQVRNCFIVFYVLNQVINDSWSFSVRNVRSHFSVTDCLSVTSAHILGRDRMLATYAINALLRREIF